MSKPETSGYLLSENPIYQDADITRYATDDPTIYVEYYSSMMGRTETVYVNPDADANDEPFGDAVEEIPAFAAYLREYDRIREKLMAEDVEFLSPEIIDSDVEDCWAAFAIPSGFYTLSEAVKSFPKGALDARDVAWMVKRALIVLKITEKSPSFNVDNFLVSPEGHSIVLIGKYQSAPSNDPADPLFQLRNLMALIVSDDENGLDQIQFLTRSANSRYHAYKRYLATGEMNFDYTDLVKEFSIKLEDIFGPPRYHHLELDPNLSKEFPGI